MLTARREQDLGARTTRFQVKEWVSPFSETSATRMCSPIIWCGLDSFLCISTETTTVLVGSTWQANTDSSRGAEIAGSSRCWCWLHYAVCVCLWPPVITSACHRLQKVLVLVILKLTVPSHPVCTGTGSRLWWTIHNTCLVRHIWYVYTVGLTLNLYLMQY